MVTTRVVASPDPRAEIDAALAAGDHAAARRFARIYLDQKPDASTARFLKARADKFWPPGRLVDHRVAFLRSFTMEPLLPLLDAEALLGGCRLETWVGAFNAYGQDILDPTSGLHGFRPQTVVLAIQTQDIAPALWSGFGALCEADARQAAEQAAGEIANLIDRLRAQSDASIIVHGLARPAMPDDGLLETSQALTQGEAIQLANTAIRTHCRSVPGARYLDYDELQARHGRLGWSDPRKWATVKLPFSAAAMHPMAREWWRYLQALILPRAKVLVLDLDNTLWGGTLGEDGVDGVALGDEHPGQHFKAFQRAILDVARRGVVLAIASKNNHADAHQMLDEHPHMLLRMPAFSATRINWEPKAQNILEMAAELNLGVDSFVFVDDNPAECEAVRRALPDVQVIELPADPTTYADLIRRHPAFERFSVSAEDLERGRYYAEERERQALSGSAETLEDFLAALEIRIVIEPVAAASLARAAQLTQKTNQLNTTTRRYSEAEMAAVLADPDRDAWVLRARDRFGDNGIVGVAVCHRRDGALEIEAFLLSCRVIGRQIETAFLAFLADDARRRGLAALEGLFIPTAKNAPAEKIYANAGLTPVEGTTPELWRVELASGAPRRPDWVSLEVSDAPVPA